MAEQDIRNAEKDLLEFEDLENVSGGRTIYEDGLNCEHMATLLIRSTEKGTKEFREAKCVTCGHKVYSMTNAKGTTLYMTEKQYRNMMNYN